MSRIGKKAGRAAQGRHRLGGGPDRQGQRPQGRTQRQAGPAKSRSKLDERWHHRHARTRIWNARPQMWGLSRTLVNNLVIGVTAGLHAEAGNPGRRLSRRGAGQESEPAARLQPRRGLSDPGRHHHHGGKAHHDYGVAASTSSWSAKSRRKSAPIARRSPIRARACATKANMSAARKARRSKMTTKLFQEAPGAHPLPASRRRRRAVRVCRSSVRASTSMPR